VESARASIGPGSDPTADRAAAAVQTAARASYGRLVALLSARDGDIAASEDALSEAFAQALTHWPRSGVPAKPDAWLLTVARNRLRNRFRHDKVTADAMSELLQRLEERAQVAAEIPDKRLALMFVCAHPAIQPELRTPLMLQTILGLDAGQIASAFLIAPAAMGQRLSRAKAKIKAAGIPFAVPDLEALPERLDDVLSAIYAAFGTSWNGVVGADEGHASLAEEAIFLARLVVSLLPDAPEASGLLALMLYSHARRQARFDDAGRFIPLKDQDPSRWSSAAIIEAEGWLVRASEAGRFGRFQCEAAIQSVHVQAPITGATNHQAIRALHEMLLQHRPSIGAFVSYAAALLAMGEAHAAATVLESLAPDDVASYQPFWVTLSAVLQARGEAAAADAARARAIGLREHPAIRAFLLNSPATTPDPPAA
jgi:RNA polymerase sigma-70 factor (ECF subfamily)